MRIALGVQYLGKDYHGWQAQDYEQHFVPTVQNVVETALSRVANHRVKVYCAGRTDTGVNALGQVIHFDTQADRKLAAWVNGSNNYLPDDVVISWAQVVANDFHARFSAQARRYCYIIANQPVRALFPLHVTWYPYQLNVSAMAQACQYFLGEQDFSSLRSASCSAVSPCRNIFALSVKNYASLILITVEANAFLHHMVRNLVGILLYIGNKNIAPAWAQEVLQARKRSNAFITAPAQGLYLQHVTYPAQYQLPNTLNNNLLEQMIITSKECAVTKKECAVTNVQQS